jgi:diguanylate cyclase (GGDEF)-like protein
MTPTSARCRASRPILLLLVFAAFLVIVGVTAMGQAALVTADSSTTLVSAAVGSDVAAVRSFVRLNLTPADVQPLGLTPDRRSTLQAGLHLLVQDGEFLHAALLTSDGTVLVSDDGSAIGQRAPSTTGLTDSVQGQKADAAIVDPSAAGALDPLSADAVLREYLPVIQGGQVYAVVAVWRDAAPILAQLEQGRIHVVVITLVAALVSVLLLFFIFRAGQQRITRQSLELVEAARRDPLTGALNHGALVEALASQVETARTTGGAIGVALLDLDNFGSLDDTYGHPAGDHVLLEIVRLLAAEMPPGVTWGRYGPDELLVVSATGAAAILEPAIERLRTALAELTVQFEGSERLPVTFSAGICAYPANGESVTTLLSMTAMTLDEAKASGGDAVRVADAGLASAASIKTFDILQGLVIAVDTKDRYTRRHSEDVARYGAFLAQQLGLDTDMVRAVHTAGQLHDIGKIGIPDVVLRTPGRLTDEEYAIVKQHVALGDAIVRDLPDLELVRAGVRHHHERWDGRGYLHELAGDEIPLVARILAVGDAFSAMTTTRPYRKAFTVEEALKRLEDAAGSQLDAHLVQVFVHGIWTAADAPIPGRTEPSDAAERLIVPNRLVA